MDQNSLLLVVDLDGTLIKTDMLMESFLGLIKKNPLYIFKVLLWLLKGKAVLKSKIAHRVDIDVSVLPYNGEFIDYLREQKANGRSLALATATHTRYAEQIAEHLQLFDRIFATKSATNIAANNKAKILCDAYGEKQFVYAGNASPDFKVWKHSSNCVVIHSSNHFKEKANRLAPMEMDFIVQKPFLLEHLKACRIHQWIKNVLIFVPIFAAHAITDVGVLVNGLLAFLAFSLCASSAYLFNDLLDLDSDRHHSTKKKRPFAAGTLPVLHGLLLVPVLLTLTSVICMFLPSLFAMVLFGYFITTTVYSLTLKKYLMLDVIILAGLYTVRLLAGAAATGIQLSEWLLAFSMFIFLSLALVKRYTELMSLRLNHVNSDAKGRGYQVGDIELLASLGTASGYLSVLVIALYISDEKIQVMYQHSQFLWGICPLLLFWISRVWIIAHRGGMNDDPIVFAVTDPVSWFTAILMGIIFLIAVL